MAAAKDFPTSLVIELRQDPSVDWIAQSVHVTNVPVELHSPGPVVVTTFGRGSTPVAALAELLDNIVNREST